MTIDSDGVNREIDKAANVRPHSSGGTGGTVYLSAGTYADTVDVRVRPPRQPLHPIG